jgi:sec-independent protein translocase protein TatA
MFGLGWGEVGIIAIAALVIFGPKKIPEIGTALGKTLRGFKNELHNSQEDLVDEDPDSYLNAEERKG